MKQTTLLFLGAALFSMLLSNGCDKDENTIVEPVAATGIKSTTDTIRVAYDGTVDVSAYFSIEPTDAPGTLTYSISRQPEYVEGNNAEYTSVTAYSVSGNTLTSAAERVPDAFSRTNDASRTVNEGQLSVALSGSTITKTVTIVQTNKPPLVPEIKLAEVLTDVEAGTLTLTTTGTHRHITNSSFVISPIDFDPNDIKVGIGAGDYITMHASGVPQAGGLNAADGTGGYVLAYYKDNTLEEVKADETLPQARLYVNVEYVAPTAIVGIEANPAIGSANTTKFYSNSNGQRKMPQNFIVVKLNNGETRAYNSGSDSGLSFLAGNFSAHLEGRTTEDTDHSGWWTYVALKAADAVPDVGTQVSFDVTVKAHFGEPEWTVTITTATTAAP
jgi:hypothetical protein